MTKRYPLRGAFGGGDAGDASDFEGIALGILEAFHGADDGGRHFNQSRGQTAVRVVMALAETSTILNASGFGVMGELFS